MAHKLILFYLNNTETMLDMLISCVQCFDSKHSRNARLIGHLLQAKSELADARLAVPEKRKR